MSFRGMVLSLALASVVLWGLPCCHADEDYGTGKETPAQRDARMKWWRDAKFGMFIHWNTSCVPGGIYHGKHNYFVGEWIMHDEKVPVAEYRSYAKRFNPVEFNPGAAVPGGCWDKLQRGNMDEYLRKISIPQLEEILTKYGKISVLWFDTSYDMDRRRADMVRAVLKLQPGIIINDRLGGNYPGDAASPEGSIPPNGMPGRDFETCMSINNTWGYKITDQNWKPRKVLLEQLVDLTSKGGNYLLNVGPNPEGEIPAPAVKRLKQVGAWTKVNGEAIFGTTASPFTKQLPCGRCTKKVDDAGTTLYFHVFNWPADGKLVVPGLKNQVETAYLLADPGKKSLPTANDASGVTVNVPAAAPDKDISVVVVRVKGKVEIAGQP